MRVEPPTRTTWWMSDLAMPASVMACSNGPLQASTRSAVISLNLARVSLRSRCLGPSEVAVMKGRLIWVSCTDDSSILAFSAASFRRCRAILSADRSTPSVFLNSVTSQSMMRWSQSSPPRWVLPEVDFTSKTPSPISRIDTSKVPPPEVEHENGLLLVLLVEPVGEGGGGRLVDDAQHLEAGDLARLLGGGALGVVEVGGHGDDGLVDGVAEVGLGVPLELLEDAGRDLLGVVLLAVDVDRPRGAHVALDRADGAVGVGDGLALGDLAHQDLARLREADHRRRGAAPSALGMTTGSPASRTLTTELVVPRSIPTALGMGVPPYSGLRAR